MTSTQVTYFLAVVKFKTFTLAAEELYISQSSLSKQIKSLEEELGCLLFYRENKENILTDAGKIFLEYAENYSKEHHALITHLNELTLQPSKKAITLGVLPVISEYNIHNDLALFQALIPSSNIYINLLENQQESLLNMLHSGKVDSIIVRTDNMDMTSYEDVVILEEDLVAVFPEKTTELCGKEVISVSELMHYPLITFDTSSDLQQTTKRIFKTKGLRPRFLYQYQRHEQILSMVNANFGVSIVPKYLVDPASYPNIQIAYLEGYPKTRTALVKLKSTPLSDELKLLFQYFSNTFESEEA